MFALPGCQSTPSPNGKVEVLHGTIDPNKVLNIFVICADVDLNICQIKFKNNLLYIIKSLYIYTLYNFILLHQNHPFCGFNSRVNKLFQKLHKELQTAQTCNFNDTCACRAFGFQVLEIHNNNVIFLLCNVLF